MIYGLLAALGWGLSGLTAAMAARRIGAFATVVVGESIGLGCCASPRETSWGWSPSPPPPSRTT